MTCICSIAERPSGCFSLAQTRKKQAATTPIVIPAATLSAVQTIPAIGLVLGAVGRLFRRHGARAR
jgi:hypothetical protein